MEQHVDVRIPARLDRFAFTSVVGLLALIGGGLGFVLLLTLVSAAWTPIYRADQRASDALNSVVAGNDRLVQVLGVITDFGGGTILNRVLLLATAYLLLRRQIRLAVFVVFASVGALILDPTLKLLVGRLRPVVDMPVAFAPGMSFPSGHALDSFVAYGVLVLVFTPVVARRWRPVLVGVAALLVVLVGFTRVALGVHFVSDVLAGWLLGAAWLAVTAAAFRHWQHDDRPPSATVRDGLLPQAGQALRTADPAERVPAHPWRAAAELTVVWVFVLGLLYGAGLQITTVLAGSPIVSADTAAVEWVVEQRTPGLADVATVGSMLGSTRGILAGTLAAAVVFLATYRRWRPVVFLLVVMAGEVSLFLVSSTIITRDRPPVPQLGPEIPPTASFPSGHVAATICLYSAVAVLAWHTRRPWLRVATIGVAIAAPVWVALARLYWGVHYPLDLVGSMLLAGPWVAACWWSILRPATNPWSRAASSP